MVMRLGWYKDTDWHRGSVYWATRTARKDYPAYEHGLFAPDRSYLDLYRNAIITPDRFLAHYEYDLRHWRQERLVRWHARFDPRTDLTLVCVCPTSLRHACHLSVLARLLGELYPTLPTLLDSESAASIAKSIANREQRHWWTEAD